MVKFTLPKDTLKKFLELVRAKSSSNDINQKSTNLVEVFILNAAKDKLWVRCVCVNTNVVTDAVLKNVAVKEEGKMPIDVDATLEMIDTLNDPITMSYDGNMVRIQDETSGWETTGIDLINIKEVGDEYPIDFRDDAGYPYGEFETETGEIFKLMFNRVVSLQVDDMKKVLKAAKIAGSSQKIMLVGLDFAMGDDKIDVEAGKVGAKSYNTSLKIKPVLTPKKGEEIKSEFGYGLGNVFSVIKGEVNLYFGETRNNDLVSTGFNMIVQYVDDDFDVLYYLQRNDITEDEE